MLFMTLSSSLVGLQPGWDLPPALQHADLQPEETLAADRREMQLPPSPLPCKVPYCLLQHRLPGLSRAAGEGVQMPTHVLQLDPLDPAVPGPWGQGVLQSLLWAASARGRCSGRRQPWSGQPMKCHQVSVSLQLEPTSRCRPPVPALGCWKAARCVSGSGGDPLAGASPRQSPSPPSLLLSIRPVVRSPTPPLPRKEEGGRFR